MEGATVIDENGQSLVIIIKLELEDEEEINSDQTIDSKEVLRTEEERSETQFENLDKQQDAALENDSISNLHCDSFQMKQNELRHSEKDFNLKFNGSQQSLMNVEDDSVKENDTFFVDKNSQPSTIVDCLSNLNDPQATELKTVGIKADGGVDELNRNETAGNNEIKNKCKKCQQDFANKTSLLLHIDDKHPEVRNPRPLPCKFCNDIFTIKPRLVRHMEKVHGKSYALVMGEQEKTNTDENFGACGWCGKEYKRVKALRNHERLHTGETSYNCNLCGNSFGLKARLDAHVRNRHKLTVLDAADVPEEMPVCEKIHSENFAKGVKGNTNYAPLFRMEANHVRQETLKWQADKFEDETTDYLKSEQNIVFDADDSTNFVKKLPRFDRKLRCHNNVQILTGDQLENNGEVEESPYICDYEGCKKSFKEYPSLKSHSKMHNSDHHKRHLMTHTEEKPHICNVCQRRFPGKDHLKKHVSLCVSSSVKKEVEINSKRRQKGEENERTDQLTRKQNVKKSPSNAGVQNIPKKTLGKNPKAFQGQGYHLCHYEDCAKRCATVKGLKDHLRMRHQEQPFVCSFEGCSEKFENYSKLRIHFITHIGKPPYVCDHGDCRKSFKIYSALKFHQKRHSGGRPHSCSHEDCGKSFKTSSELKIHLRTHTGERPYVCDECNRPFSRKENLKRHMRIHTGEKHNVCGRCKKGFSGAHLLKKHATSCVAA